MKVNVLFIKRYVHKLQELNKWFKTFTYFNTIMWEGTYVNEKLLNIPM